jgi:hypothetical protein
LSPANHRPIFTIWKTWDAKLGNRETRADYDELTDHLLQEAMQDASRAHKRNGESIVVRRDGNVVTLTVVEVDERADARWPSDLF